MPPPGENAAKLSQPGRGIVQMVQDAAAVDVIVGTGRQVRDVEERTGDEADRSQVSGRDSAFRDGARRA